MSSTYRTLSNGPALRPDLNIPQSDQVCQLSIIDTTCNIVCTTSRTVEPNIPGHDWINFPTFSFYIKHETTSRQVLFDLGMRRDWQNSVPWIRATVSTNVDGLDIARDVHDILTDGGVDLTKVEAMVMSHWHWDHCGNPAALPKNVKIVVGPGFRDAFIPGWPANPKSPFHEADFDGREVMEVSFSDNLKIGRYQAYDYFGDGSLYVLNVPGHAIGHIGALVRTTPDTLVYLGGDVCHHSGVIRPTRYIPMPDFIPEETRFTNKLISHPCPCAAFLSSHPEKENGRTVPFFRASTASNSFFVDPATAQDSIEALIEYDADPNVLVCLAHDPTALATFDFFPNGTLNDWKIKRWKQGLHWGFLEELPYYGKVIQPLMVDGLYDDGKKLRDLEFPESWSLPPLPA